MVRVKETCSQSHKSFHFLGIDSKQRLRPVFFSSVILVSDTETIYKHFVKHENLKTNCILSDLHHLKIITKKTFVKKPKSPINTTTTAIPQSLRQVSFKYLAAVISIQSIPEAHKLSFHHSCGFMVRT